MKGANKLLIFAGVALALVAVLLGITMSSGGNQADAQKEEDPGTVQVVKAAVDFEPHTVISMADIVVEEVAADQAPSDVATDLSTVLNQSYALGAVKGDFILSSYLQAPGITSSIAAGKRAMSVEVDNQGMMAGLIMGGDYVDLVFQARVDLRRLLQAGIVEVEEDGPYSVNDVAPQDGDETQQQFQGADGSEFTVLDGGQNLEPVVKMLVQDIQVLRVVAPGVQYDAQGQQVGSGSDEGDPIDPEVTGQLILEVTPEQAEAIAFMTDQNHSFEVVVRGTDDHEVVTTTGITFEILMSDGTWSMPWPKPITAPGGANEQSTPES